MRNWVAGVAGTCAARSAYPNASDHTIRPSTATATAKPGIAGRASRRRSHGPVQPRPPTGRRRPVPRAARRTPSVRDRREGRTPAGRRRRPTGPSARDARAPSLTPLGERVRYPANPWTTSASRPTRCAGSTSPDPCSCSPTPGRGERADLRASRLSGARDHQRGIAYAQGYADGERISRAEMLAVVARIAATVAVPVTADMEAGYGRAPQAVAETVRGVIAAGRWG